MIDAEFRDEQIESRLLEPLLAPQQNVFRDMHDLEDVIAEVAIDLGMGTYNVMGRLQKMIERSDKLPSSRKLLLVNWLYERRTANVRTT